METAGNTVTETVPFGLPELHALGAILWRRGMGLALGEWVRRGDWAEADANEVVDLIGRENAERVYSR